MIAYESAQRQTETASTSENSTESVCTRSDSKLHIDKSAVLEGAARIQGRGPCTKRAVSVANLKIHFLKKLSVN